MPSDSPVIDALRRPIATYRSYVAGARDRVRALLASDNAVDRARRELGAFGGTRIDVTRFAELRHGVTLDAVSRARLERAGEVLRDIDAAEDDRLFIIDVAPGDSLRVSVARALARLGRAFAASRVADLVRAGHYEPERHERLLYEFPFERWSRAEREHAPPLVARVEGADLRAGGLAELLDGSVRIVLLVHGKTTPAPLARLVTPGTFVMQASDVGALARVAAFEGPAIAAIVDQDAAQFVHDPTQGQSLWQRLTIAARPASLAKTSVGGVSARQQREELLHLDALSERPVLPNGFLDALIPKGDGDPADRLTAWLLAESGLTKPR